MFKTLKTVFLVGFFALLLMGGCCSSYNASLVTDCVVELNCSSAPLSEEPCGASFCDLNDIKSWEGFVGDWDPQACNEVTGLRSVMIALSHVRFCAPEDGEQVRARLANFFDAMNKSGFRYAVYVRRVCDLDGFYLRSNPSLSVDKAFHIDENGNIFLISAASKVRMSRSNAWRMIESGGGALVTLDAAGFFGVHNADVYLSIKTLNSCTSSNVKWALVRVAKTGQSKFL